MKKFLLTAITLIVFIVACDKDEMQESFNLGVEKSFHLNGEYLSSDKLLQFTITAINDSRCPSDVTCVWEGKADVTITVEKPVSGTLVLNTFDNKIDTLGNFSFKLMDLSPYPISTKTIALEDYDVTLKIEEI